MSKTRVLTKLKYLCTIIIDYAKETYNIENWPEVLDNDLTQVEDIERSIVSHEHTISSHEMLLCNKIYKKYNTLTKGVPYE